jgi:hypothetical protein
MRPRLIRHPRGAFSCILPRSTRVRLFDQGQGSLPCDILPILIFLRATRSQHPFLSPPPSKSNSSLPLPFSSTSGSATRVKGSNTPIAPKPPCVHLSKIVGCSSPLKPVPLSCSSLPFLMTYVFMLFSLKLSVHFSSSFPPSFSLPLNLCFYIKTWVPTPPQL